MGETVKIWPYNILETGTVVVSGTPDSGYPATRLFDRSINLLWKVTTGGDAFGFDDSMGIDGDRMGPHRCRRSSRCPYRSPHIGGYQCNQLSLATTPQRLHCRWF